jgi:hypothetical protein
MTDVYRTVKKLKQGVNIESIAIWMHVCWCTIQTYKKPEQLYLLSLSIIRQ